MGTGNAESLANSGAVSAHGRYVGFESAASDLIAADGNGLRDSQSGVTSRVSTGLASAESNGISRSAVISANGLHVAFVSTATNLVSNDTNGTWDIFRKALQAGAIVRATTDMNGVAGNSESGNAAVSADGRYVAFQSVASNLVAGVISSGSNVFITENPFAFNITPHAYGTATLTIRTTDTRSFRKCRKNSSAWTS